MNKRLLGVASLALILSSSVVAQKTFDGKVITEVKEWRVEGQKRRVLDHHTKYDEKGNKAEEIEYLANGDMRDRVVYEYNEKGKCIKETHYDEFNKLKKTVTFEYHENGKKKLQSTFLPNGKLKSTKEFEYILK